MFFKIIMTMNMTRLCFRTQHQTCKTKTTVCKTKTVFFVSDRSCPKTDSLGPHQWRPAVKGRKPNIQPHREPDRVTSECSERCKHCTLSVVRQSQKVFSPLQTPFPGAQDGQNLISWRWSLPLPTNPVW